jgi:2'-5' RNA ligase
MLRLFIAVTLPEEALAACAKETRRVEQALGSLAKGERVPRAEGLHFTVKFLGPTAEELVAPLRAALEKAAAQVDPFALSLGGLRAFPTPGAPASSTWRPPRASRRCSRSRRRWSSTSRRSASRPRRAATPARHAGPVKDFKAAQRIGARVAELPALAVARFEVRDVALMLSELGAGASRYTALARIPWDRPVPPSRWRAEAAGAVTAGGGSSRVASRQPHACGSTGGQAESPLSAKPEGARVGAAGGSLACPARQKYRISRESGPASVRLFMAHDAARQSW